MQSFLGRGYRQLADQQSIDAFEFESDVSARMRASGVTDRAHGRHAEAVR
jgi:hypothetical protein